MSSLQIIGIVVGFYGLLLLILTMVPSPQNHVRLNRMVGLGGLAFCLLFAVMGFFIR